jgi:hypothetical protein
MDLFNELVTKKLNNYNTVNIYFGKQTNEHKFDTFKLTPKILKQTKENLSKKTKNKCLSWDQIEYSFDNTTKTEKYYSNNTHEITYEIKSVDNFIMLDGNTLVIVEKSHPIDKECFPPLDTYDNVINKKYEKYFFDEFDVLFITQNEETIVCVNLNKRTGLTRSKLEEVLKIVNIQN